jgi:hypothetical protein
MDEELGHAITTARAAGSCARAVSSRGGRAQGVEACETGDGGTVVVEFVRRDATYALTFDAEGVLANVAWWGAEVPRAAQTFAYERRDGKWLLQGWETVATEGAPTWTYRTELQHETVAGYVAPKSVRVVETAAATAPRRGLRLPHRLEVQRRREVTPGCAGPRSPHPSPARQPAPPRPAGLRRGKL